MPPAPNTLKRWNGSGWVTIFDHDSYVSVIGDFMIGPLTLRAGTSGAPLTNANLIGADSAGVEWGRVAFTSTALTLQATGASKTVALSPNATARFTVTDTAVTSLLALTLPAQTAPGMTNIDSAVRKDYVDSADFLLLPKTTAASTYLNKTTADTLAGPVTVSGAITMTGAAAALTLALDPPTAAMHAAPKKYVDDAATTLNTNKVSKVGDTVSGLLTLNDTTNSEKIRMTNRVDSYISGWTFNSPAQIGYLSFAEGAGAVQPHYVRLVAATGNRVALYTNGVDRLIINADGTLDLKGATSITGTLAVSGDVTLGDAAADTTTVHDLSVIGNAVLSTVPTSPSHAARKDYVDDRQCVAFTFNGTANTTNASTGGDSLGNPIVVASISVPAQTRAGILTIAAHVRVQKTVATDIYQIVINDTTVPASPATIGTSQTRNAAATLEYLTVTTYRGAVANTARSIDVEFNRVSGTGTGSTIVSQANNNLTVVYVPS